MSFLNRIRKFISARKLYPTGRNDRVLLWTLMVSLVLGFFVTAEPISLEFAPLAALFLLFGAVIVWLYVYVAQDVPKDQFGDYTLAIANIENVSNQLSQLVSFLKQERQKVEESEATLRKLHEERTTLEPMVLAQRDTVNAILSAHSGSLASRAWKERALGFISGLFTSFIASVVFEYFRR